MNKVPQLHGRIYHFNGDKYYKIENYKNGRLHGYSYTFDRTCIFVNITKIISNLDQKHIYIKT